MFHLPKKTKQKPWTRGGVLRYIFGEALQAAVPSEKEEFIVTNREEAYREGQKDTAFVMFRTALLAGASKIIIDKLLEVAELDDEELDMLNDEVLEIRQKRREDRAYQNGVQAGIENIKDLIEK